MILTLSSSAVRMSDPGVHVGGFGVACVAIEALTKQAAGALGPQGIRVVGLQPTGIPEAARMQEEIRAFLESNALLRRLPTLAEVGNVAAFIASDQASAMTLTVANISCGTVVDSWLRSPALTIP